jgi:hypothetical protein
MDAEAVSRRLEDRGRGPDRQVVSLRAQVHPSGVQGDRRSFSRLGREIIRQGKPAEDRLEAMKSVTFPRENPKEEIDLGVG